MAHISIMCYELHWINTNAPIKDTITLKSTVLFFHWILITNIEILIIYHFIIHKPAVLRLKQRAEDFDKILGDPLHMPSCLVFIWGSWVCEWVGLLLLYLLLSSFHSLCFSCPTFMWQVFFILCDILFICDSLFLFTVYFLILKNEGMNEKLVTMVKVPSKLSTNAFWVRDNKFSPLE